MIPLQSSASRAAESTPVDRRAALAMTKAASRHGERSAAIHAPASQSRHGEPSAPIPAPALTPRELGLIAGVLQRHPALTSATLFGSRAKGTHAPQSDIDIALRGLPQGAAGALSAQAIAAELDELPLPQQFDVQAYEHISSPALRQHIERVGICIYPAHTGAHTGAPAPQPGSAA